MAYVKPESEKEKDEELKRRLLNAAVVLLGRSGLHAVTMKNVASHVGCSSRIGAIYKLYPGKDEIIAALANRKLAEDLEAIEGNATGMMQLARSLAIFAERMKRPWLVRGLFEISHYRAGVLNIFRKLIEQAGVVKDPDLSATLVVSVLYGAAVFGKRQEPEAVAMAALRAMGIPPGAAEAAVVNARYETA